MTDAEMIDLLHRATEVLHRGSWAGNVEVIELIEQVQVALRDRQLFPQPDRGCSSCGALPTDKCQDWCATRVLPAIPPIIWKRVDP